MRSAAYQRPSVHSDPIANAVNVMCGELLERRGAAAADFVRDRLPEDLLVSQRVSIARALLPYVRNAAAARQATTGTAPGRRLVSKRSPLHSFPFVARCVGLGRKTLRQAIAVLEFVESNPEHRHRVFQMDRGVHIYKNYRGVACAYDLIKGFSGAWNESGAAPDPHSAFGTEFGTRLLRDIFQGFVNVPKGSRAFGSVRKKKGRDRTCSGHVSSHGQVAQRV